MFSKKLLTIILFSFAAMPAVAIKKEVASVAQKKNSYAGAKSAGFFLAGLGAGTLAVISGCCALIAGKKCYDSFPDAYSEKRSSALLRVITGFIHGLALSLNLAESFCMDNSSCCSGVYIIEDKKDLLSSSARVSILGLGMFSVLSYLSIYCFKNSYTHYQDFAKSKSGKKI